MPQSGSATEAINSMRVAVIGSRIFEGSNLIAHYLDRELTKYSELSIISGGASGVDTIAKQYAFERKIDYVELKADWRSYGRAAGPIRNKQVVEMADTIYAFWDGKSKGTWGVIQFARKLGKPCQVITFAESALIEHSSEQS